MEIQLGERGVGSMVEYQLPRHNDETEIRDGNCQYSVVSKHKSRTWIAEGAFGPLEPARNPVSVSQSQ